MCGANVFNIIRNKILYYFLLLSMYLLWESYNYLLHHANLHFI